MKKQKSPSPLVDEESGFFNLMLARHGAAFDRKTCDKIFKEMREVQESGGKYGSIVRLLVDEPSASYFIYCPFSLGTMENSLFDALVSKYGTDLEGVPDWLMQAVAVELAEIFEATHA